MRVYSSQHAYVIFSTISHHFTSIGKKLSGTHVDIANVGCISEMRSPRVVVFSKCEMRLHECDVQLRLANLLRHLKCLVSVYRP